MASSAGCSCGPGEDEPGDQARGRYRWPSRRSGRRPPPRVAFGQDEHRADRHLEDGVAEVQGGADGQPRAAIVRPRLHHVEPRPGSGPGRMASKHPRSPRPRPGAPRCAGVWYRLTCTTSSAGERRQGWGWGGARAAAAASATRLGEDGGHGQPGDGLPRVD